MSDTPRTDAISGWSVNYRGKSSSEELYIDPKGPFVHSTFARHLERELNAAIASETRLRAALATSKDPCIYCLLPKEQMAECRAGFPGCSRADDLMGCPELGASLDAERLERELAEANHRIRRLIEERDSARIQADHKWKLREEFEALLGTSEVEVGVEKIKKMKAFIDDLKEIGRHTGETATRVWHGGVGWLHNGDVLYIGKEKP